MDTFEYITAIVAVMIGLAIADMATSLHRLLRHRKVVRWDWVAPVAALMILAELFNLWWQWHGFTGKTIGEVVPYFAELILIYLAACITLPDEVPANGIDLGHYFDENRTYFWFVYPAYVAVFMGLKAISGLQHGRTASELWSENYIDYLWIVVGFGMIFVRQRWISGLLLLATLVWFVWGLDWWSRVPDAPT
jgi:hypothetical protein